MAEIVIKDGKVENKPEGLKENDISESIRKFDEANKLKEANDALEKEINRAEELKAKIAIGGRAQAGQAQEKTQEEKDAEEAKKLISLFR